MEKQSFLVHFDSGQTVEVEYKSRDIAKLERAGVVIEDTSPVVGSYALAFVALERMKRQGAIDFDLPESAEALEDVADIDVIGDPEDSEGEGSGQAAVTG